jgi:hypothetical protein
MADTLYPYQKIVGVEIAPYEQKYPTWGQFVTQIYYDGVNVPYLGFFDENNTLIYENLGTVCGTNLYKWSYNLNNYTNLYNKCIHAYIYTNQQNIVDSQPLNVIAESEILYVSSKYNDEVVQIEYVNNEIFDTVDYTNYTNYAYVSTQFGHEYNFEETSTTYEKSNGSILKLSSTLKDNRQFLTDYIPRFEHEKLNLAFMHDSVIINGESFVKKSEYTINPIERYSLSQGSTILSTSNYNFVNSNCL